MLKFRRTLAKCHYRGQKRLYIECGSPQFWIAFELTVDIESLKSLQI